MPLEPPRAKPAIAIGRVKLFLNDDALLQQTIETAHGVEAMMHSDAVVA